MGGGELFNLYEHELFRGCSVGEGGVGIDVIYVAAVELFPLLYQQFPSGGVGSLAIKT